MSHYRCSQVVSCGWQGSEAELEWSGPHVKVTCPKCKKFIKFAKQDRLDHGDMRALDAWQQEQVDEANEEEHWVMATFRDGSEEQIGEVTFDSSNPPTELEIDGVVYRGEF